MTMIDADDLETPSKAVKLTASDWRKLTALAVTAIVVLAGVSSSLAVSIVNAKVDDIKFVKDQMAVIERRVDFAERDIQAHEKKSEEMRNDLKEALRLMHRIAASLEARGFPVAATQPPPPKGS